MKKRAEYRTEVKTRLTDREYAAFQLFKRVNHLESDSATLARIVQLHLFGALDGLQALLADALDTES